MSNRVNIDVYERTNLRTNGMDFVVEIYDEYYHANLIFAEKSDVPDDDMELLTEIIRAKHDGEHGSDCEGVRAILDYVEEHEIYITIGETSYNWDEIKETMKYDFRNVYACPVCSNESWDDDCGECPECVFGTQMQFVKQEQYEK